MAHRKRQSTASSMLDHRARPGPIPHDQEPESEDTELPLESYVPTGLELGTLRPESPTPEEQECHNHSPDGDSSSDYVNNTSEEEDYDEGLPEEEEGVTYYIRYCPEDDQEEDGHYCSSKESYQDYYPPETNGNTGGASPYRMRRGDGDLEEQEEDIDQIVAEIKMSLSMTSITSASEASPEHMPELDPGDSTEACPPSDTGHGPGRQEARPKSLNLPPEVKHPGDLQRGLKTKTRTPKESCRAILCETYQSSATFSSRLMKGAHR